MCILLFTRMSQLGLLIGSHTEKCDTSLLL